MTVATAPRLGWTVHARAPFDAPAAKGGIVWHYEAAEHYAMPVDSFESSFVAGRDAIFHTVTGPPSNLRLATIPENQLDPALSSPPNTQLISGQIRNLCDAIAWPGGRTRNRKVTLTPEERRLVVVITALEGCLG